MPARSHPNTARGRRMTALGVLFAALAMLLVAPAPAFACTCGGPMSPLEALADTDAVFAGEVLTVSETDGVLTVRFEVEEVWKGDVHEVQTITTYADGAACGYWFDAGDAHLVYADLKQDGTLTTSVCARTTSLEWAEEDLDALGPGGAPLDGRSDPSAWWDLAGVFVIAGAIVGAILVTRHVRRPASAAGDGTADGPRVVTRGDPR